MNKRIESLDELKRLSDMRVIEEPLECFIALKGGLISRKNIYYDSGEEKFHVFHSIDDTEGEYTEKELCEETNVVNAMNKGALLVDEVDWKEGRVGYENSSI